MKKAVVLFNLGGASSLKNVQPYLYNIFSDPAIVSFPNPLRIMFAWGLSHLRKKKTQAIYKELGGKSPLLDNTLCQAKALENALGENYRVIVAMRYWHPRTEEVIAQIKGDQPNEIILLPLYPQYSTSTTQSSVNEFERLRRRDIPHIPVKVIDSYPQLEGFIQALADLIKISIQNIKEPYRVLFTAHGIPLKMIEKGDPYQREVEETVKKVVSILNIPNMDYQICYQSRVGYLPWLMPYTIDEIKRAGLQKKSIVVVPISFVSENSETLYELDIEYKELAENVGIPRYLRVPTVSVHPQFIQGLADLVKSGRVSDDVKVRA